MREEAAGLQAARRGRAGGPAGEPEHEDGARGARAARLPRRSLEAGLPVRVDPLVHGLSRPAQRVLRHVLRQEDEGKRQAWVNDAFDKELEAGRDTRDPKKRIANYAKAEEIMQTDVGYVPVAWVVRYAAAKPTVTGWRRTGRARPWSTATSTWTCSRTSTWSRRRSVSRYHGAPRRSRGVPSSTEERTTIPGSLHMTHIRPRSRPAS